MRLPSIDIDNFKKRRSKVAKAMAENSALLLVSHPSYIRNNDVEHPYRQDSNFYYLTGFEEPESIFLFRPGMTPETVMFVRQKDPLKETWDGFRYGLEATKDVFQVDETHGIDEFTKVAPTLLNECNSVYYRMFHNYEFDLTFEQVMDQVKSLRGRSSKGLLSVHDSYPLLGELRIIKSDFELQMLERACDISSEAHIELMKAVNPGMNERALHGKFIYEIMQRGSAREGYGSIVAGGDNATTLHYVFNDQVLMAGELLLVDAGAEFNHYSGDITRTYPINGNFNDAQRRIYLKVLNVQKYIVDMVKPGLPFKSLMDTSIEMLTEVMLEEGLLKGSKKEILEKQEYKKYYPHGLGHWLGMDVHDAGKYEINGESRQLEAGMVFTVEPGLYIPASDTQAPDELRGVGIRIEDNIAVTADGYKNMTEKAPKDPEDMERLISG